MKIIKVAKKNVKYDSGWTAVLIPEKISKKIFNFSSKIPEREVFTDEDGSKGKEDQPHVTIQYGIKNNDFEKIEDIFSKEASGNLKLGKMSVFENERYDVLKISVSSPKLHALKKKILDNVECENKFPKYLPHVTIAYLHPGVAEKYVEKYKDMFDGIECDFNEIVFRSKEDKKAKSIKLK